MSLSIEIGNCSAVLYYCQSPREAEEAAKMKRDITEGMVMKGGLNNKPKGERPSPPKGQGGTQPKICPALSKKQPCCATVSRACSNGANYRARGERWAKCPLRIIYFCGV